MYLNLLKLLGGLCILTTFWSGVRVAEISVFEWLALLFIGAGALYTPPRTAGEEPPVKPFKLAIAGLAVMALGGIISAPGSFDMIESLTKAAKLVAAFMLTVGVGYVAATRKLFSLTQMLRLLAISAAICSVVAVMQGQLGMLMQFVPKVNVAEGGRMTGLAEHPIEMGLVSAYGVAASLGLAVQTRKWVLASAMMAIDAYSTRFSASLTAVIALMLSVVVICLYTRQYRALVAGAVGAVGVTALVLAGGGKGSALLLDRVNLLFASGGNYGTVQSREAQLGAVLESVSPSTVIIGNGYSEADLPYKMEIHNGILASIYHFGFLGLLAQLLVIGFILSRMRADASRAQKCALLGSILIFMLAYLSGPPQARPSLWAPPLFLAALLTSVRRKAASPSSDTLFGQLNEPIQPHP